MRNDDGPFASSRNVGGEEECTNNRDAECGDVHEVCNASCYTELIHVGPPRFEATIGILWHGVYVVVPIIVAAGLRVKTAVVMAFVNE